MLNVQLRVRAGSAAREKNITTRDKRGGELSQDGGMGGREVEKEKERSGEGRADACGDEEGSGITRGGTDRDTDS